MPQRPIVILALSTLTWVACNTVIPGNPPAPTPTLPAVTRVVITGLPGSLTIGQTVQLTASVTLPDGTTLRTSEVTWTSSDDKVITVSAAGLLTVIGLGEADVTATDRGVRGVAHITIAKPIPQPVTYDISGVVHESAPTENVMLSGATVGIHFAGCPTCPHEGQETTTDDQGRFTLPGIVTAGFTLWVRKPGYEATPFNIAMLPRDRHPDIGLAPSLALVQEVWEGTMLPECAPPGPTSPPGSTGEATRDRTFAVHHDGLLRLQYVQISGFEVGINVYQGSLWLSPTNCSPGSCTWMDPFLVHAGFLYRIQVGSVYCTGNGNFRVVFTHPN